MARNVSITFSARETLTNLGAGFNLREEMSEVKTVLEGEGEDRAKCNLLHRRYQSLVREYKRLERRLVECQKKQLEVSFPFLPLSHHVSVPFQVAQHRDIIQNEYARANLARSKLENLCRELQKHSKQVAVSSPAQGVKFQAPSSSPPPLSLFFTTGGEPAASEGGGGETERGVGEVPDHHQRDHDEATGAPPEEPGTPAGEHGVSLSPYAQWLRGCDDFFQTC